MREGISFGFSVEVFEEGHSGPSLGEGGGVGIESCGCCVCCEETFSEVSRKFWRPLRLGTRKL